MPPPPPTLSPPLLFSPHDLQSRPSLATQIIALSNAAFKRSRAPDPEKWSTLPRFQNGPEQYFDMLVPDSLVAAIVDHVETDAGVEEKVVACAAAVPWKGGWRQEGAGTETGWELKAVVVDGASEYSKKGLAIQVMDELQRSLAEKVKERGERELVLWVLAADCINGKYWPKRGFREVRRSTEETGVWGCKTRFDMVVFRKEIVVVE